VFPVELIGGAVRLRELDPRRDAPAAFVWAADPAFFRFLPAEPVATEQEELGFLRGLEAQTHERPRRGYHLGIEVSGELLGIARLTISTPAHAAGDIGYGIRPDAWGRGITTQAVRLLLGFGFDVLGLHRISAVHHPDNIGSGRVMQKVGMRHEGVFRDHMLVHGAWRNSVAYAILEPDWRARTAEP
jgi:RimJ/RimL family protein N-acetyltransferase